MKLLLILIAIGLNGFVYCYASDAPQEKRACDEYIQKYCSSSEQKGPGCLKGHEADVSADCLKDMQHGGGHHDHGGGPGGKPEPAPSGNQ